MLIMKLSLRFQSLAIVPFLSLALVGCSNSSNYSDTYESMLLSIEIAENRLEEGKPIYYPKTSEFVSCISSYSDNTWLCEEERAALEAAYRELSDKWDFQADKAEMASIRVPGNQPELNRARDAFISHIGAWEAYLFAKTMDLPRSMFDLNANTQIAKWTETILSENEISETFATACSALGNAQPNDTEKFKTRIVDICDD
jgi:hypothetical protein